jgi:tripartite-type tricarboxylate transporter receptor subunit TctC
MNAFIPSPRRRRLVAAALATPAASLFAGSAFAEQPLRIVLGYPPGGSTDVVARILEPRLRAELGVPVVVDTKAGANGAIGTDFVAKAAPDGNTLLLITASPLVVVPHVQKTPYDTVRDIAPIGMIGQTPEALGVNPSSGVTNLQQLLERAKREDLRLASSGNGGLPHLTIELLKATAGGRVIHVPYKGGGPAITDAIAGHVDGVVMDLAALVPHFKAGKLRPLVVTSARRDPFVPDVPNAREAGLGNFEAVNWMGLFAPAKTPPALIEKYHKVLSRIVMEPEVAEKLRGVGLQPAVSASSAEFTQFVANEYARWGKVAKDAGLRNE